MGPCGVGIFPAVKHSAENRLFWPYHWYTIGTLPLPSDVSIVGNGAGQIGRAA